MNNFKLPFNYTYNILLLQKSSYIWLTHLCQHLIYTYVSKNRKGRENERDSVVNYRMLMQRGLPRLVHLSFFLPSLLTAQCFSIENVQQIYADTLSIWFVVSGTFICTQWSRDRRYCSESIKEKRYILVIFKSGHCKTTEHGTFKFFNKIWFFEPKKRFIMKSLEIMENECSEAKILISRCVEKTIKTRPPGAFDSSYADKISFFVELLGYVIYAS